MKTTKPRFTILVLSIILLSSTWMLPLAYGALPEIPGGGDTYSDYGLLDWLQYVQPGTTSIILEIDYSDLHPVQFHVAESLGLFTECTGFGTNFKTSDYYKNYQNAMKKVEANADMLGLCYKLVDIEWCAQVHPDP